jgi:hypothetical protein
LDLDDTIVLDTSPKTVTVANGGNYQVKAIVLAFAAKAAAPVSNITVASGSCSWTWTGTIAATKTLSVDCGTRTIRNDGADAYAGFGFNPAHTVADWLVLQPGNNSVTITWTCGGTATELTFTYYEGWA